MRRKVIRAASLICFAGGLALAGPPAARWTERAIISGRSESAWNSVVRDGREAKPGEPVARLIIPQVGLAENVLLGDSEENLNRGPALLDERHGAGARVIIAHRDQHFNPLKRLKRGMELRWVTRSDVEVYTISDIEIMHPDAAPGRLAALREDELALLTCHPFHFFGNAPDRFLAVARLR